MSIFKDIKVIQPVYLQSGNFKTGVQWRIVAVTSSGGAF
jgi:hypothetical protein